MEAVDKRWKTDYDQKGLISIEIMSTLFLNSPGLPSPARAVLATHLAFIYEPTPTQWFVIGLITLSALAIFLRIKLG
jgi:hypothetical protein